MSLREAVILYGDNWRQHTPQFWTYNDLGADSYEMNIHTWSKLYLPNRKHPA
jgi:hypothetical protein